MPMPASAASMSQLPRIAGMKTMTAQHFSTPRSKRTVSGGVPTATADSVVITSSRLSDLTAHM